MALPIVRFVGRYFALLSFIFVVTIPIVGFLFSFLQEPPQGSWLFLIIMLVFQFSVWVVIYYRFWRKELVQGASAGAVLHEGPSYNTTSSLGKGLAHGWLRLTPEQLYFVQLLPDHGTCGTTLTIPLDSVASIQQGRFKLLFPTLEVALRDGTMYTFVVENRKAWLEALPLYPDTARPAIA